MATRIRKHNGSASGTVPLAEAHNALARRIGPGRCAHLDVTEHNPIPPCGDSIESCIETLNACRGLLLEHVVCPLAHVKADPIVPRILLARSHVEVTKVAGQLERALADHVEREGIHYHARSTPTFGDEAGRTAIELLCSRVAEIRRAVLEEIEDAPDGAAMVRMVDA